jgi:hypothetical protein
MGTNLISNFQCCHYQLGTFDVGIPTELPADNIFYGVDVSSMEARWYVNQTAFRKKGAEECDA